MAAAELLVFGTIALAVGCWAVGEAFRNRACWVLGALLTTVHSVAAFVTIYGGSHDIARRETARQTAALTGLEFTGGIYINYAFLLVWSADAVWWLASPRTYTSRPAPLSWAVRAFIFFIVFNGAVVFADGWARVIGTAAVALVVAAAAARLVARNAGPRTLWWN